MTEIHDGFSPRRMTVDEYVEYVETGKRDPHVWLPLAADARRAEDILVERGVIKRITPGAENIQASADE